MSWAWPLLYPPDNETLQSKLAACTVPANSTTPSSTMANLPVGHVSDCPKHAAASVFSLSRPSAPSLGSRLTVQPLDDPAICGASAAALEMPVPVSPVGPSL